MTTLQINNSDEVTAPLIVFDVYFESNEGKGFINVPDAERIAQSLNLEFVHYIKGPNTPEWIESQSNSESVQAIRNGVGPGKNREGVVVRPLVESKFPNGKRIILKHKNAEFWEIKTRRPLGEKLKIVDNINEIVNDWVTDERYEHVKDRVLQQKANKTLEAKDVKLFLDLMVEDVQRESEGEVVWSNDLIRSIRQVAAAMFKNKNGFLLRM